MTQVTDASSPGSERSRFFRFLSPLRYIHSSSVPSCTNEIFGKQIINIYSSVTVHPEIHVGPMVMQGLAFIEVSRFSHLRVARAVNEPTSFLSASSHFNSTNCRFNRCMLPVLRGQRRSNFHPWRLKLARQCARTIDHSSRRIPHLSSRVIFLDCCETKLGSRST